MREMKKRTLFVLALLAAGCSEPRACVYGPYVQVSRTISFAVDTGQSTPAQVIRKGTSIHIDSIRVCQ